MSQYGRAGKARTSFKRRRQAAPCGENWAEAKSWRGSKTRLSESLRPGLEAGSRRRRFLPSGLYWAVVLATKDVMRDEPGVWVEGPDGELVPDYESTFPEIT